MSTARLLVESQREADKLPFWAHFELSPVAISGDVLSEAELAAWSAAASLPCEVCGKDTRHDPKVGYAEIMAEKDPDGTPVVWRWFRLCTSCCLVAQAEDAALGEDEPGLPYIYRLKVYPQNEEA